MVVEIVGENVHYTAQIQSLYGDFLMWKKGPTEWKQMGGFYSQRAR